MAKLVNGKVVAESQADIDQQVIDATPKDATIPQIKAEASRRIMLLAGAENKEDMILKEMNAIMRGISLNNKLIETGSLTVDEQAEVDTLKALEAAIAAIRTASDLIEQTPPTIDNLQTDSRWPSV